MYLWHRVIHLITAHFRKQRGLFLQMTFPDLRNYRICDLGGSRHFWEELDLGISSGNIKIYNIDDGETAGLRHGEEDTIEIILYDGKKIPVNDGEFDLCVCNSVIEHVPLDGRAALVAEMHRVATRLFCQTPAYEFPLEPHFVMPFIHWLPRQLGFFFAKISVWRILSRPSTELINNYWWETHLLTKADICTLFPDAKIGEERVLGLCKSYYVIVPADNASSKQTTGCVRSASSA